MIQTLMAFILSRPWLVNLNAITRKFTARTFLTQLDDLAMSRTLHIEITESAEELKRIMNEQTRAKFRERLQILYLIKTGLFASLQELADHLGRSKSVIVKWLKLYRTQGLVGLLNVVPLYLKLSWLSGNSV